MSIPRQNHKNPEINNAFKPLYNAKEFFKLMRLAQKKMVVVLYSSFWKQHETYV
jgi:hypothetical protein